MQHFQWPFQLSVKVSDILTLDAGWWEETMEETASGKPLPCRLIHPPEPTMYDQVLRHLEMISRETRVPPKSQLNFREVALATIAVCLRWGTYFAVLADRTKPIWPQTEQEEISMIGDEEILLVSYSLECQSQLPWLLCQSFHAKRGRAMEFQNLQGFTSICKPRRHTLSSLRWYLSE